MYDLQLQLNKQELMQATVCYNKVLENCLNNMDNYLKSPERSYNSSKSKGNFLIQLECFNAMVKKWNKTFPGIEPRLKKNLDKMEIISYLENLIQQCIKSKNNEDIIYFQKFIALIKNDNSQEFIKKDKVMNNFQNDNSIPSEEKTNSMAHLIIGKNMKLDQFLREQEKKEYEDYDINY